MASLHSFREMSLARDAHSESGESQAGGESSTCISRRPWPAALPRGRRTARPAGPSRTRAPSAEKRRPARTAQHSTASHRNHHASYSSSRAGQGMWHGTAAEALLPALLPCPSSEGALFHTGTHRTTQTHVNESGLLPQPLLWTHPDPDPDPDPGRLALTDRARSFCGGDMAKEKPLAEGSSLPSLLRPRWAGRFEAAAAAARHTPANREPRTRNKEQRTVNRER